MSDYGREWERIRQRIEKARVLVKKATGREFANLAELREHVHLLQTLAKQWDQEEHAIYSITEEDR